MPEIASANDLKTSFDKVCAGVGRKFRHEIATDPSQARTDTYLMGIRAQWNRWNGVGPRGDERNGEMSATGTRRIAGFLRGIGRAASRIAETESALADDFQTDRTGRRARRETVAWMPKTVTVE